MKKVFNRLKIVLLLVTFGFTFVNFSYADLFNYQIIVSKIATDTEQAKRDAIYEARLTALKNVMQKLTSIKYNKIILKNLNIETAVSFEQGFQINDEQFFKGKYVASITFLFDKSKVIQFLDENEIPYTESQGSRYLLIYNQQQLDVLPDVKSWEFYWENYSPENFTTDIIAKEINTVDINDKTSLEKLKSQLNLQDIFILNVATTKPTAEIFSEPDEDILKDSTDKKEDSEKKMPRMLDAVYDITIKSVLSEHDVGTKTKDLSDAFMFVIQGVDDQNKNNIFSRYSHKSDNLILSIDTSDYEKRIAIEKNIKNIIGISNVYVKEIDYGSIKLHLSYKDTVAMLQKELSKQCIDFNLSTLYLDLSEDCSVY